MKWWGSSVTPSFTFSFTVSIKKKNGNHNQDLKLSYPTIKLHKEYLNKNFLFLFVIKFSIIYNKSASEKKKEIWCSLKEIWCSFLSNTHQHHDCNSVFSGICLLPKAVTSSLPTFQNRPIFPPTWWLASTCFSALLKCDPSSPGYEGNPKISLHHQELVHLCSNLTTVAGFKKLNRS